MSDSRVMNTEIRSVRAFGFRKNLQTEIRNRKWSDGFFLTWELELVSTKACNNAYYSNQTTDAIQNLPTVSFAFKLTYVSIYNNHYIHKQLPLNKIQQKLCFETKTVVAGQQCLFTLCKLEDHLREARNRVPAGQSSPVDFGTRQLVKQLMTSLNQPMETLETVVQNIVSSISKQDSVNHTMHMFKVIQITIIARIIRWYMQQQE